MSNTPQNIYIVDNTADDVAVAGTLRYELAQAQADISANAKTGDGGYFDEVTFAPALTGMTITLNSTLNVGSGIILDGTAGGAGNVRISGNSNVTVFTVPGTAAPDGNTAVTIQNLTIANGYAKGAGGTDGTPSSTAGTSGGDAAGGIFLQGGHLSVSNDTFSNVRATGGMGGSGYNDPGNGKGVGQTKGAGGNGGNAAGAIYVEPGAIVDYAHGLIVDTNSASPGLAGFGMPGGTTGSAYPVSNDETVNSNTTIVCFASETRIRTVRGDIAVEDLAVGDLVVTASGAARPIRWIGHRSVDCRRHPRPCEVMPVHITAHAFGDNRPARALVVSPGHAVCVDLLGEVLIPAIALVNGSTIRQVDVDKVDYWHVELDSHDVILAENLPAESYLDMGNRGFFGQAQVIALPGRPSLRLVESAERKGPARHAARV